MGMVVRTNSMASNAYRSLGINNKAVSKSLEKLSSGFKINRAGDDASGLAISEKMKAQIKGLDTASANAQDGISLIQTAEGATTQIHSMLNRMVELSTKSANGTIQNEVDREAIQAEVDALNTEITRISKATNFNGINLLDGSLTAQDLTTVPVEMTKTNMAAGVNIDNVQAGGGTKGEFTIDLQGKFGTGDSITITGTRGDVNKTAFSLAMTYTSASQIAAGATFFNGETVEDQAASLAEQLKTNNDLSDFDIRAEGSKVIMTAKKEGLDGGKIANIQVGDKTVKLGQDTVTAGAAGAGTTFSGGWNNAFSDNVSGASFVPQVGDELTFNFLNNGVTYAAKVTVTDDMVSNYTAETFTKKVTDALKDSKFVDNTNTAADESKIKVSDVFDVTANSVATTAGGTFGSIKVAAKNAATMAVGKIEIKRDGMTSNVSIAGAQAVTGGGATTVGSYGVAAGSENFTKGDKFKISGVLADGDAFEVVLEAGKDFDIGGDYETSMSNIVNQLNSVDPDTHIKATTESGRAIETEEIFGATTNHEFSAVTAAGGALTIESKRGGVSTKGFSGKITNVSVTPAEQADAKFTPNSAKAQTAATSSVTIDKNIAYGTTIKIGDKNFEIVADSHDASSRNNEVVVIADLDKRLSSEIATELGKAVQSAYANERNADGTQAKYNVNVQGSTMTISTNDIGSDVAAIDISTPYGEEVATANFKFDPTKVKEGSYFSVNGNDYQFVKTGEKAKDGYTAIEVDRFDKATAKSLGDAFMAVNKVGKTTVADDGTVSVLGGENADGQLMDPTVSFYKGLTLQIGDTNEDFNKVSVSVDNLSAEGIGTANLNVSSQDAAGNAIQTVKDAINKVSTNRANLGALQNRLEYTIENLDNTSENISSANSAIRDTDMAKEMMKYTQMNILTQAAQSMLAQANQQPQQILQLLQ